MSSGEESDISTGESTGSTLGGLYALFITVLGLVLPIIFFVEGEGHDSGLYLAIFNIYLYAVSFFFLLYLQCCLMTKRRRRSAYLDERADSVDLEVVLNDAGGKEEETKDTNRKEDLCLDANPLERLTSQEASPPFSYTAPGVNVFLRFGVIVFGMGSVVLDGFRLLQFVETQASWLCYGDFYIVDTVLRLAFVFAETFFIFKNHKLVVNFKKPFVKFGLVHLVATNLCIWNMIIVMETSESYNLSRKAPAFSGSPVVLPTEGPSGYYGGPLYMNTTYEIHRLCHEQHTLSDKAAPYLYPCAIQFAILAAAILARIFTNVGGVMLPAPAQRAERHRGVCHKANTGLFLGLVVVVVTCIATCFFLLYRTGQLPLDSFIAELVFFSNDIFVLASTLLVVFVAFCKVSKLNKAALLDRFNQNVMFVGLAGYYAFYICLLIPWVKMVSSHGMMGRSSVLMIVVCILAVSQATTQVTFIVDALRRCCANRRQAKAKPGRTLITFLLISNLAMWIIDSFELKELHSASCYQEYYGHLAWQIMIHVFLPLAVLFRFLSAVCFAEIWVKAYKRPEHSTSFSEAEENKVQHVG